MRTRTFAPPQNNKDQKQLFLPQNMLSLAHIGLAGAFGALLVGWLVVVVRRLYLARHLYILWLIRDTVKNVLADFFR